MKIKFNENFDAYTDYKTQTIDILISNTNEAFELGMLFEKIITQNLEGVKIEGGIRLPLVKMKKED